MKNKYKVLLHSTTLMALMIVMIIPPYFLLWELSYRGYSFTYLLAWGSGVFAAIGMVFFLLAAKMIEIQLLMHDKPQIKYYLEKEYSKWVRK